MGLIPARAGKTSSVQLRERQPWAHPRACGENLGGALTVIQGLGSSPRVRGKLLRGEHHKCNPRLIPARAGKTPLGGRPPRATRAHPRACGENPHPSWVRGPPLGSSPRVRGKLSFVTLAIQAGRLIPARAGKTWSAGRRSTPSAAHPRACGENRLMVVVMGWSPGSSPRVRGKHAPECASECEAGLIPARAGKTTTPAERRAQ